MVATHVELQRLISTLDADVPELLRTHPAPDAFWQAFNARAQQIQDRAADTDHGWVCDRLDALLERSHLVPPADQI
ncbi:MULTISPECIES: hypothetical protein [Dyella]|nr:MULTISPECIES: hypothetical protein [Dyella]TBR39703.1 hypothetical protein EYV96_05795 [Dyella terrae]